MAIILPSRITVLLPWGAQLVNWGGGIQTWVLVTPKTESPLTESLEIAANEEMCHSDPASRKHCPAVRALRVWFTNTATPSPPGSASGRPAGVLIMFNNQLLGER